MTQLTSTDFTGDDILKIIFVFIKCLNMFYDMSINRHFNEYHKAMLKCTLKINLRDFKSLSSIDITKQCLNILGR